MKDVKTSFGHFDNFSSNIKFIRNIESSIIRFKWNYFDIELFAQNIPTREQYAYRHMIIEYKVLKDRGDSFKRSIVELKKNGFTTEEAFAKFLGLKNDPYEELLKLKIN